MRFGLILGDQLHHQLATLKALDRTWYVILMAEVVEEATYVAHHPQKIALIFSAMRHFAKELKAEGWRVRYHAFKSDSPNRSQQDFIDECRSEESSGSRQRPFRIIKRPHSAWIICNISSQGIFPSRRLSYIKTYRFPPSGTSMYAAHSRT